MEVTNRIRKLIHLSPKDYMGGRNGEMIFTYTYVKV